MRRLVKFARHLLWLKRSHLLTRHNVRAAWIQSEPRWLEKLEPIDLTDEEWDAWQEAMR